MDDLIAPRETPGRPKYLTVAQVAEWLDVSQSWVYRKASDGTIPSIKLGTHIRFREESIARWMASQEA